VTLFLAVSEMNEQHAPPATIKALHYASTEMLRCSQHDSALLLPRHRPHSPEVAVIVKDLNTNEQHPGTTIDFLL
jgi:hypothetical protein